MDITKTLIEFALNTNADDIPVEYLKVQNNSLIDAIGTMQAATSQCEVFSNFIEYARARSEDRKCKIFSTDLYVMPDTAAFVNGALSHAMDLEDTCQAAVLHSNAVTTPALLALAQYKGNVSGKDLVSALLIGSEIACRISIACGEDLSKHGWYMPPVFGSYGAVLAGCRLMGYNYNQTLDALAANSYSVSGLSQMIDDKKSLMRAVRDGFGARSAVQSVLFAEKNSSLGFENFFEGDKGFFKAYAKLGCKPEILIENLGKKYYASELVFKFWPACLGCHTSIQSTIEVMKENDLLFSDILSAHVKGSDFVRSIVVDPRDVKNRPITAISAKFSLPYCMGLAAKRGKVQLSDFLPENIPDEDIYDFAKRVSFEVNPELTEKWQGNFVDIIFHTKKGDYTKHREAALGDPSCPFSDEQFKEKFRSCMVLSANKYSEDEIEKLYSLLNNILSVDSVLPIINMM